jgi:nicotinate-nucleotide adenylyltransferase
MILLSDLKDAPKDAVFFSGTFFPWHEGHQECVAQALAHKLNLVVCPDQSPWKNFKIEDSSELEMKLNNLPVWLYSGFLKGSGRNPTIKWVESLAPGQCSLLMGDDSFLSIEKWQDANKLMQILKRIFVVPRQGDKVALLEQKKRLSVINQNLEIQFLSHHAFEHISSSERRK